jgi:carbonic anhydrase
MFIRILLGGIVASLFAMVITLSIVNTGKTKDLDTRLVKASKQIKEQEETLQKLEEAIQALADKGKGVSNAATPRWGYEGETGPANWGKQYPTCAEGKSQSPLNIVGPFDKSTTTLKADYKPGVLKLVNNGHTIQVNVSPGSTLKVGNESYELVYFHFRRPSEEQIDGKPMAMEMHMVHKSADGKLAVLAVLMRESAVQNRTLWSIWKNMPAKEGPEVEVASVSINPATLLPESLAHYSYDGSLTTPPCTEGVKFFVLKSPIGIQREMIDSFPFKMNARPVQPLNGRKIQAS